MKSLIEIVKEKIIKDIPDCNIDIIDNTHLHKHHKSFNKSKTHLKMVSVYAKFYLIGILFWTIHILILDT